MESTANKKIYLVILKIMVSGALLFFILKKAGARNVIDSFRSMDMRFFLLAMLIYLVMVGILVLRWGLLLDARVPFKKLFSLHMIGGFFNNFLPGSVGGDAVKVYYLYRYIKKTGASFGSVFLDRYVGLFACLSIGLIAGMAAFPELRTIRMHWVIPLFFAAFISGSLLFFRLRIGGRFGAIADFYEYVHACLKNKRLILKAFALSVIIQALVITTIAVIALGFGLKLSFTALFVFVPIINTVMAVPVSISGLGVREGAFVVLFGLVGIPPQLSASISILWFLSVAAVSLIGLAEYIRYRKKS